MPRDPRAGFSLSKLPENYLERLMAMDEQIKRGQKMDQGAARTDQTALQEFRKRKFGGF